MLFLNMFLFILPFIAEYHLVKLYSTRLQFFDKRNNVNSTGRITTIHLGKQSCLSKKKPRPCQWLGPMCDGT